MDPVTGGHRSTELRSHAASSRFPKPWEPVVVAASFAKRLTLLAFAALALRGLAHGADFQVTLRTALLAMPVFFALGLLCAEIARRVVEERVDAEFDRRASETETLPANAVGNDRT